MGDRVPHEYVDDSGEDPKFKCVDYLYSYLRSL